MTKNNNTKLNETGFASLVIALVMITVMALLTVAFSQLSRREQQSALSKQLATQAYFAAESGVNDVYKAIQQPNPTISTTTAGYDPTHCLPASLLPNGNGTISSGVGYTCVLLNLAPPTLSYDLAAGAGHTAFFSVSNATAGTPISITINWNSSDGQNASAPFPAKFTPSGTWNSGAKHPPVIQFSITPLGPLGSNTLARNTLINQTFTTYLYPGCGGPGSVAYNTSSVTQAPIVYSSPCGATNKVTITGIPYNSGTDSYLVRLVDTYDKAHIDLNGNQLGGGAISFPNSVAQIDSTGKARNVLKRIWVQVDINPPTVQPNDTLQANNICKREQTAPTDPLLNTNGTNFVYPGGGAIAPGTADPCNLIK